MKIVIPGGSGQVGNILSRAFVAEGHEVVILSRGAASSKVRTVAWDAETLGPWVSELEGADVVINLAGRSVNCRYYGLNRRQMMDSRVSSTRVIGEAIAGAKNPPRVWLQASTATIYAHRFDAPNDEATGIIGGNEPGAPEKWNFSIDVAKSWERAANEIATPKTRKVLMRSAVTLSPDRGGIFDTILGLTRKGLGGTNGDGRQFVSWVHDRDFVRAVKWLIEREDLDGAVNIASPNPVPNAEFMRELRQAWGIPIGLPATAWMLEIGALFMRTETELVLKSRRVVPKRLLDSGFTFEIPTWPEAAKDLCERVMSGYLLSIDLPIDPALICIEHLEGFCPVQGTGTVSGNRFYFRARHNSWSFSLSEDARIDPVYIDSGEKGYFIEEYYDVGGGDAGRMSLDEARKFIKRCAAQYLVRGRQT